MRFIPYNIGTFLVRSQSRQRYVHHVDLIDCTCSCEAFEFDGTCRHLREAYRRRRAGQLPMIVKMEGRA
jgi:SWIM zinc finger